MAPLGLSADVFERLAAALDAERYGDAIELIEQHLATHDVVDAQLRVTYARCLHDWAERVMRDRRQEFCGRALVQLDLAVSQGIPEAFVADLRSRAAELVAEEAARDARARDLMGRAPAFVDDETLSDGAYLLWDSGFPSVAATWFEERWKRRRASDPLAAITYRARAGFCLADAGEWDEAEPILRETIAFDWLARGPDDNLFMDRYDGATAWCLLLFREVSLGRWARVLELADEAARWAERHDLAFPVTYVDQERLFDVCVERGWTERARSLAGLLRTGRSVLPVPLQEKLDAFDRRSDGGPSGAGRRDGTC